MASLIQEAEQLKLVLKRELDRMEAELRTKDAIISDYKNITQILQVFPETVMHTPILHACFLTG